MCNCQIHTLSLSLSLSLGCYNRFVIMRIMRLKLEGNLLKECGCVEEMEYLVWSIWFKSEEWVIGKLKIEERVLNVNVRAMRSDPGWDSTMATKTEICSVYTYTREHVGPATISVPLFLFHFPCATCYFFKRRGYLCWITLEKHQNHCVLWSFIYLFLLKFFL
jgi:hypothetical protein